MVSGPMLGVKTPWPLQVIKGKMLKVELNGMADADESTSVRFEKKGEIYWSRAVLEEGDSGRLERVESHFWLCIASS